MRRTWVIAAREYRASVRTKAFLVSLILMPILMGGGVLLPKLMRGRVDVEDKRIVVADGSGRLLARLLDAAERRNGTEVMDRKTGRQVEPRFFIEAAPSPTLDDQQRLELSQKIREGKLHAFAEIDRDVFTHAQLPVLTGPPPVRLHILSAPTSGLARWFTRAVNQAIQRERLQDAGLELTVVARALAPVDVGSMGLHTRNRDGTVGSGDERSHEAGFFVPIGVVFLAFLALMMSQTMLQSTLEEKQQRIAEVLLGSVRPHELMLGKVLGSAAVSLTTMAIYLAGGSWLLHENGLSGLLRQGLLAAILIFPVAGVLLYGSLFGAVGAACSELKEAQNYLLPVMMVLIFPLMVWWKVMEEPTSGFATALSFVPLWTPMLMPLRLAATEAVPLWQPIVALLATLATAAVTVWAGGRVFRVGLLLQGKPPRFTQLLGWIFRG
jgi:ABC-2 type transport system permease protein